MNLNQYGWNPFFEKSLTSSNHKNLIPGRIVASYGKYFKVITNSGELLTELAGKYKNEAITTGVMPAVGDFVLLEKLPNEDKGIIHEILPRLTKFSRKAAGKQFIEQVLVTNFDSVFIFCALNSNFNLRRIERYLVLAWESGAIPVVILSKADLCEDVEDKLYRVRAIAPGVDVYPISSIMNVGLEDIRKYIRPGKTIALLGSSGVGKSTLINTIAGEEILKVSATRESDDKGRHTTTHRELVMLPNGAMIIDTPGMRELALWDGDMGVSEAFNDIDEIGKQCKFSDCKHKGEPGCAVRQAIEEGLLDVNRYESYIKLQKEARYIESKSNQKIRMEEKKKSKNIAKYIRDKRSV